MGGGAEEIERATDLARDLCVDHIDGGLGVLDRPTLHLAPQLQRLRLFVAQAEHLLDRLRVSVAAQRGVPGELRHPVLQDVDVHDRRPQVDQADDLLAIQLIRQLEGVLEGEGIHIDHHGVETGRGDDREVIVDDVLLHRDQQDVQLVGVGIGALQDLKVQVDVLDGVRDILLGLERDRLLQLFGLHLGDSDLLDDDRVPRHGDHDVLRLDLILGEDLLDCRDHRPGVHDDSVDDGLRMQRCDAEPH